MAVHENNKYSTRDGDGETQYRKNFKVSIIDQTVHTKSETKEYDPYDYCTSKEPTSYLDSVVHYLKASIGTGILAIPSSFNESGYVYGIGGVIFVSVYFAVCMHLLLASEYELCKRKRVPNMSYAGTVHAAFTEGPPRLRWLASIGKFFANFFIVILAVGSCTVYVIFIPSNVKQLIDFYYHSDIDMRMLMAYVMIPLVLICWIRNLKIFVPLSAAANFICVACFILVFWYILREPLTLENQVPFGKISNLPHYLTTILFATGSVGIILPLKAEMKKPKEFSSALGVLNLSQIHIALLYAIFGLFGYLKYGDRLEGSITLNLPSDELLAQGIKGLYSLAIMVTYFLYFYIVFDIVWKSYLSAKIEHNRIMWEYLTRTLIPLITFLLAYSIPNLGAFISLVGALGISSTCLVIPILLHTLVFWNSFESSTRFTFFILKNMILLALAIMIFVSGLVESLRDVIQLWRS